MRKADLPQEAGVECRVHIPFFPIWLTVRMDVQKIIIATTSPLRVIYIQ